MSLSDQIPAFKRIIPDSQFISSSTDLTKGIGSLHANCAISADGKRILSLSAVIDKFGNLNNWKKHVRENTLIEANGQKSFRFGEEGLSSPNSTAIFVPCSTEDEDGRRRNGYALSVLVNSYGTAKSESGEHRQDLVNLAARMAQYAASEAQCSEAQNLPQHAPQVRAVSKSG
ncbi:hypothetical protein [Streptomyces sp. H27-D2]|uniref:hypothetical protein n=1 Tax=Streptomyces sp. H27-D2 TaxID=3046304 RepID=UPI002DBC03A5|nr:hypothetical protein [Streptomyces sp. H27-D2]MEC4019186.1 hypothetical protein [Streptomyces sp. H27-D2]